MLPFIDLAAQYATLKEAIDRRMQRVLDHGHYIMGPEVAELEARLAARTGVRHCVTTASGTEALLIALMALDLQPGDEVITTPFSFIATAEVIVRLGGRPAYGEIEPDTCNLDAADIEARITPRTRAILPVSLYGQPSDMATINAIADRHGLTVIEDAAQSFGAEYRGDQSCHLSHIGCTSFFPSKPLGCYGDGGALFTDDDAIAQAAREIRVHGQSQRYQHTRVGVGGRMDTLQCAVVLAKLDHFDWELTQRRIIGEHYDRLLDAAGIPHVTVRPDRSSVHAQYTVFVEERTRVQEGLREAGIPTAVHYPLPIYRQAAYLDDGLTPEAYPHTEAAAARVLSLPMHPYLTEQTQVAIVDALARQVSMEHPR